MQYQELMTATLLLIDDNAIQAATRQAILKRAGYNVISALSPESALDQIREDRFDGQIDLIITDHLMPGMTGSEFVTNLRGFAPEIPVLVISGLAEAEEEYRSLSVEFHLKPCPPDNLLGCVERLLRARRSATIEPHTNQLPFRRPVADVLQKS
jgi:DNA-binding NtrC family response regulator